MAAIFSCLLVPGAVWAVPQFTFIQSNPFGLSNVSFWAVMCHADIDGDGDLDIFVGDVSGRTFYFQNTGSATSPAFINLGAFHFGINVDGHSAPTFGDLDGDGDLDAIIYNGASGGPFYFENTGNSTTPSFVSTSNPLGLPALSDRTHLRLVDLDGDGDLDLFGIMGGNAHGFVPNTGNSTAPSFGAPVSNPFGTSTTFYMLWGADLADIDGDGDLDYFATNKNGNPYFFHNTGNSTNPEFAPGLRYHFGLQQFEFYGTPSMADIDGDGDPDAFFSTFYGNSRFYQNMDPGVLSGGITLLDPPTTDQDTVQFQMTFIEPVSPTFISTDLVPIGSLSSSAQIVLSDSVADPVYTVSLRLDNPDANGTIGLRINGTAGGASGYYLFVPHDSLLYTIANYPPGDVNKNGTFDLSDVALAADANLGLATLP